jgi:hypothetical protein
MQDNQCSFQKDTNLPQSARKFQVNHLFRHNI